MKFAEALLEAEKKNTFIFCNLGTPILCFKLDRTPWELLWKPYRAAHWRAGGVSRLDVHAIAIDDGWQVFDSNKNYFLE